MLAVGTLHALRIVLGAILKPNDQVWCEDPGYPAARRAIEHCGYRPVSVPVDVSGMVVSKARIRASGARGLCDAVASVSARCPDGDAALGLRDCGRSRCRRRLPQDDCRETHDGAAHALAATLSISLIEGLARRPDAHRNRVFPRAADRATRWIGGGDSRPRRR